MEISFESPEQRFPVAVHQYIHRFSHPAMATEFGIWIRHDDEEYAKQAAWDAFRLLERLELEMSRYEPASDVSRLNALLQGESIQIGEHAFECLKQAFVVYEATHGAFDVTMGAIKDFWMQDASWWKRIASRFSTANPPVGMDHLHLLDGEWTVIADKAVNVDLGAIGKGYAVDRMLERLTEWDISDVLVHGGASSVAAMGCSPGARGWSVTIRHPLRREIVLAQFDLENRAMGASGLDKGNHIIDPRTKKPAHGVLAVWVTAPDATAADAFSTAFMVMPADGVEACLEQRPELRALVIQRSSVKESIFRWGMGEDK